MPPAPEVFAECVVRHYRALGPATSTDADVDGEYFRLAHAYMCAIEETRQGDGGKIPALPFGDTANLDDEPAVVPVSVLLPPLALDGVGHGAERSISFDSDEDDEHRVLRRKPMRGKHSRKSSSLSQCAFRTPSAQEPGRE